MTPNIFSGLVLSFHREMEEKYVQVGELNSGIWKAMKK